MWGKGQDLGSHRLLPYLLCTLGQVPPAPTLRACASVKDVMREGRVSPVPGTPRRLGEGQVLTQQARSPGPHADPPLQTVPQPPSVFQVPGEGSFPLYYDPDFCLACMKPGFIL